MEVVNLFAYRTSKPSLLKQAAERTSHGAEFSSAPVSSPIGKDNAPRSGSLRDRYILESVQRCDRVILAWGNHGTWRQQDLYTLELLKNHNHFYSLGITKRGCPRHPLYLRSTIKPQKYEMIV